MAGEIEEWDQENIQDNALGQVLENRPKGKKNRWETWVALSSSMLAVLSVVAALLATFASDEATTASSDGTDFAVAAEGVKSSHTILKVKIDLLAAMGKPTTDADIGELNRIESQAKALLERSKSSTEKFRRAFEVHDLFAISIALFQLTMLLSGLAVMVGEIALWRFGLVFSAFGLYFFLRGLLAYSGYE